MCRTFAASSARLRVPLWVMRFSAASPLRLLLACLAQLFSGQQRLQCFLDARQPALGPVLVLLIHSSFISLCPLSGPSVSPGRAYCSEELMADT